VLGDALPGGAIRVGNKIVMPVAATERRSTFYWLLLAGLGIIAAGIGLRDPWPADEPRFALIARDMVETGRWFFPRVAGVLYPDKPPIYFWITGAFYAATGSVRTAFLLPSLAAALTTLTLIYDLARRLWGRSEAWWATAALLVCVQFLMFAKSARIDATLMMLVTLGMYGILRHLLTGPDWNWYVAGFVASGLGVITKGVGFLPVFVLLAYLPARWLHWQHLPDLAPRWWQWLAGPAAMLAVIGMWLIPMLWLVAAGDDPALHAYRDNILFKQTGERYTDSWHHFEPPWYYLVEVIPLFWFPLSLALVWLVPAWVPLVKQRDARLILPLAWTIMVIVFFSISPGKRGAYLLPALPMLALSAGPFLADIVGRRSVRAAALVALVAMVLLLAGSLLWIGIFSGARFETLTQRYDIEAEIVWFLAAAVLVAVCCLLAAWRWHAVASLAAWLTGLWVTAGLVGYPLLNDARTPAGVMAETAQAVGDAELGLVGWKEQHILFAKRPVVHFGYRRPDREAELHDGLTWLLQDDYRYLLVTDKFPTSCVDLQRARNMGYRHRQNWYLVQSADVLHDCRRRLAASPSIEQLYHANQHLTAQQP